jgi:hypothetical protein
VNSDTHSFVVRIWNDASNSPEIAASWRGSIDHVGSGKRVYFRDLQKMMRFIQDSAGVDFDSQPSEGEPDPPDSM